MRRWQRFAAVIALVAFGLSILGGGAASANAATARLPFWDVIGTKFEAPVQRLWSLGVVSGTSAQTFAPGAPVTRAQMAAFMVRILGLQQETGVQRPQVFVDVPVGHWAFGSVAAAQERGIVAGVAPNRFAPDEQVTYAQAVTMILRALGYEAQISGEWPVGHVLKARELNLLEGTAFGVNLPATRGDIALMLDKAVFQIADARTGQTLSQSVFQVAASLIIGPDQEYLLQGSTQLSALGLDAAGQLITLRSAEWRVVSGPGFVTEQGLLHVSGADPVTVHMRSGNLEALRTYHPVQSIRIRADDAFLSPGSSLDLQAEGLTAAGKAVPVTPEWRVISGPAAVDAGGTLTATGAGVIRVEAALGALVDQVDVTAISALTVSPSLVVLTPGEHTQFTARATGPDGKDVPVAIRWALGSGDGSVTDTGLVTAGTHDAVIEAHAGSFTASATVRVISKLEVSPASVELVKGSVQQFTVRALTADGREVAVQPAWTVEPEIGVIDPHGRLVATAEGTAQVKATFRTLTGSTTMHVAGEPTGIIVTASPGTVPANGETPIEIQARVVDNKGNTVRSGIGNMAFSVSNAALGTLSAYQTAVVDGVATVSFTPSTTATIGDIIASIPDLAIPSGSVSVTTTVATPQRIALSIYPSTLAADGSSRATITAKLVDEFGATLANTSGAALQVSLTSVGTGAGHLINTGITIPHGQSQGTAQWQAGTGVGTAEIRGSSTYAVTPTSVSTVVVGPATQLAFAPSIAATKADGVSEMDVKVEVRDANGYIRTGDYTTQVTLRAESDDNSLAAQVQTVNGGVATFKLKTTTAGHYRLRAIAAIAGLSAVETAVDFLPGAASRLTLSVDPVGNIAADAGATEVRLQARIEDSYGNLVPSAAHKVTFTRLQNQDATSLPAATEVYATGGVAVLPIQSTNKTGTDTFRAAAAGLTDSGIVSVQSRITGIPLKLRVQHISDFVAGRTVTVQVHVLDVLDQTVTSDNGRAISLLTDSGTAVVGSPQLTVAGVATFELHETKVGSIKVTAAADGLQADSVGRTPTVSVGPADHIALQADPAAVSADGISQANVQARVVDQYGNPRVESYTVNLQLSDGTIGTITPAAVSTGATAVFRASTKPGTVTITGTSTALPVGSVTIQTHLPGTPERVVVEQATPVTAGTAKANEMTIRVRIVDANGNVVTSVNTGADLTAVGLTVEGAAQSQTLTLSPGQHATLTAHGFTSDGRTRGAALVQNGRAEFTLTNTRAETVTLRPVVYYKGNPLPVSTSTATTLPGAATSLVVDPAQRMLPTTHAGSATVTAKVVDQYGNPVKASGEVITFSLSHQQYAQLQGVTSVSAPEGTAVATVASKVDASGGTTILTARSTRTGLSGTATIVTDRVPDKPQLTATNSAGTSTTVTSGDTAARVRVTLSARTAEQSITVYLDGLAVPLYTAVHSDQKLETVPAGSTVVIGYIKRVDMGSVGTKQVRVLLSNGLGVSPLSDAAQFTLQ